MNLTRCIMMRGHRQQLKNRPSSATFVSWVCRRRPVTMKFGRLALTGLVQLVDQESHEEFSWVNLSSCKAYRKLALQHHPDKNPGQTLEPNLYRITMPSPFFLLPLAKHMTAYGSYFADVFRGKKLLLRSNSERWLRHMTKSVNI